MNCRGRCLMFFAALVGFGPGAIERSARAADDTPRLVVVVSVDQFAYEYLERFRAGFHDQGLFRRCDRDGSWFTNCHHRHGVTTTAPGHSVQLTGASPDTNGIVDNGWIDRATGKEIYCVADPHAKLIGQQAGDEPVSPRNLLCDTLGDRLKIVTNGQSKVFTVSLKDRAAILLAGHAADGAFWLSKAGHWITSNAYRTEVPAYLRSSNPLGPGARFSGKTWDLLYERRHYQHPEKEDSLGEGPPAGMKGDFPHTIAEAGTKNFLRQMEVSPFGNDLAIEAARLILADEELGKDDYPDILGINLASNDYVGHSYGPESLEVEDITYRTDRLLGEFIDFVNEQLGGRPWIFVLTADHGVAPIPERVAHRKIPARRNALVLDSKTQFGSAHQMLEVYLREHLGIGEAKPGLVMAVIESQVYLRADHPALKGDQFAQAQRLTRDWLLTQNDVAAAVTREQILSGGATGQLEAALRHSFQPRRSGDVLFCLEPYDIEGSTTATHGSPWDYDTHVPLLLMKLGKPSLAGGLPHGRFNRRVSPSMIAPTLAALLHVPPPGGCLEQPILELLPHGEVHAQ
jgi:predicted AlkP superfamily pyrophosphatase or phosphodiesterase